MVGEQGRRRVVGEHPGRRAVQVQGGHRHHEEGQQGFAAGHDSVVLRGGDVHLCLHVDPQARAALRQPTSRAGIWVLHGLYDDWLLVHKVRYGLAPLPRVVHAGRLPSRGCFPWTACHWCDERLHYPRILLRLRVCVRAVLAWYGHHQEQVRARGGSCHHLQRLPHPPQHHRRRRPLQPRGDLGQRCVRDMRLPAVRRCGDDARLHHYGQVG
mmetsp:Transcript_56918/g.139690  ORF Transcript_56918/g.139690 Transcript_56918/m.139690 type:complete len:212 (+) Transcript_56918:731-1366(+)